MTAPIAPQRLAELRERYDTGTDDALEALLELMATGHDGWLTKGRTNWVESIKAYQADHVALLTEVERLRSEEAARPEKSDDADPDAWRCSDEQHREWSVRQYSAEGVLVDQPTASRDMAQEVIAGFENWHDTDGSDPRPDFRLELVWRQVGPWIVERGEEDAW